MDQCTLYMVLPSEEEFVTLVTEFFPGWKVTVEGQRVTVRERGLFSVQSLTCHVRSRAGNGRDFAAMLAEMRSFYAAVPTAKTAVQKPLLAQIEVFTVTAGIVAAKPLDEETIARLLAVAGAGHGLLLLPPASLHTADGALVFNVAGESDLEKYSVYAPASILDERVRVTASGEARKKRSNEMLAARDVPICATLPPIIGDEDCTPRTLEEVAARTLGVLFTAVYAEFLGERSLAEARAAVNGLLDRFDAHEFLSPAERAFMADPVPQAQDIANFSWRYECAWVGLWALGFVEKLYYPGSICDVAAMAAQVRQYDGFATFCASAALRPPAVILDEADLIYRYDWACVDARIHARSAPAELDAGVVMERHRMLNWLIRYTDADWDDVCTDT